MKLNNKGWGTVEMLLLSGGLLVALIISVFFISKLYGNLDNSTANKQYIDLENKIEIKARDYIKNNSINIEDSLKVNLSTLIYHNLIDEFNDANGNKCDGYVMVTNTDDTYYYRGYISCEGYVTSNY